MLGSSSHVMMRVLMMLVSSSHVRVMMRVMMMMVSSSHAQALPASRDWLHAEGALACGESRHCHRPACARLPPPPTAVRVCVSWQKAESLYHRVAVLLLFFFNVGQHAFWQPRLHVLAHKSCRGTGRPAAAGPL